MNQKQYSQFIEKCGEIFLKEQEDYKRKKLIKGEKIDYSKMYKAINQRKKIKKLNKITNMIMFKTFSDTREMINKFKEGYPEEKVFYINENKDRK